jgi:hypothetical protein
MAGEGNHSPRGNPEAAYLPAFLFCSSRRDVLKKFLIATFVLAAAALPSVAAGKCKCAAPERKPLFPRVYANRHPSPVIPAASGTPVAQASPPARVAAEPVPEPVYVALASAVACSGEKCSLKR